MRGIGVTMLTITLATAGCAPPPAPPPTLTVGCYETVPDPDTIFDVDVRFQGPLTGVAAFANAVLYEPASECANQIGASLTLVAAGNEGDAIALCQQIFQNAAQALLLSDTWQTSLPPNVWSCGSDDAAFLQFLPAEGLCRPEEGDSIRYLGPDDAPSNLEIYPFSFDCSGPPELATVVFQANLADASALCATVDPSTPQAEPLLQFSFPALWRCVET